MSNFKDANSCPDGYRALSTSELQELLQKEDKMDQIIRLNEKFQELQMDRETLLTSNRSLAEENLSRRPRLNNGKVQLAAKYQQLSKLTATCREKRSQLEAHTQKHSLQTAQNLLQEEVAGAEERSEELLEKFMEGSVALEEFLDSFRSSRKVYHVRRAQVEKVQEASRARRQPPGGRSGTGPGSVVAEPTKDPMHPPSRDLPQQPNGFVAQGPLRVFQLRYGLTPAFLVPRCPVSPPSPAAASAPLPEPPRLGQAHVLGTPVAVGPPASGHGQPVGLRVIGQLAGGWPMGARPVRVQQLYRPSPQHLEPPYR